MLDARLIPGTVTNPAGRPVDSDDTGDFDQAQQVLFRGRGDTPKTRLVPGETAYGLFLATFGRTGSHGFGVQMEIGRQQYLELRELGSRP